MRRMTTRQSQILALWVGMTALLCASVPETLADALRATTPEVCAAAVALGLALIKEMNGDSK